MHTLTEYYAKGLADVGNGQSGDDERLSTVGVIVREPTSLTSSSLPTISNCLVSTNIEPCSIAENIPSLRNMFSEQESRDRERTAQKLFVTGFIGRCEPLAKAHSEIQVVNL